MVQPQQFRRWFNRDFWRALDNPGFPIETPKPEFRSDLVDRVYHQIVSARYAPSIPEAEIILNKGYGVARTVPVFCAEDYCVYYFCIKELEDVLCGNRTPNTFGGWALGGKLRKQEYSELECESTDYGRYSFNPKAWVHAFGEFNSLLFAQLDQGNYSHILQFDLSNFYDCVRLDILERWIREDGNSSKGWIIALLFFLLNQWNRRNTGLHPQAVGLPQDALADCSRILANFYLQRYDRFAASICTQMGGLYFRYADDQMILLKGTDDIEKLLLLLTRRLDRDGLRVNQKKVQLWEAADLQRNRFRNIHSIFSDKGDNQKPPLVRKFVDAYLKVTEDDLKSSWNQGRPLLNRLVYANLESLAQHHFDRVLERFVTDDYLLEADHRKLSRVFDLNAKSFMPIDFSKRIKELGTRSVHNRFHFEALAFAKNKGLLTLVKFMEERLDHLEQMLRAEPILNE